MAEIKTIKDISQSVSEVPRRITKSGTVDAELTSSGEIIKSGVPGTPAVFKTIEEPQRFLGKSGLENINLDLQDCTGQYFEFEYLCENNLIKSAFNDNTDDTPLASFIIKSDNTETEKWINYKPYNCNTASGVASSNTITYENVYNGVDIQYENQKNDIKQYITLKDSTAQTVFDFTVTNSSDIELISEELPLLSIQYTGVSAEGTIEVTSGNHIIGRTQSSTSFDLDLTSGDYDTFQELVTYIDNLSAWSASIITGSGTCRSKTLSVIGITDCKTSEITLNAELKSVKAVNPDMPNSRTFWQIRRPFANSNRSGSETSYGFVELIPASEHVNGTYDVIRITIDSSWISSEFSSGATEIVIDPTTYRTIRDYGNITFCGDYASGNQHGTNGFMNGYGLINRGTEAVQTGGTRVENDSASITYVDPDGTEYAGGAANKGVWIYYSTGSASSGSLHYAQYNREGGKVKLTFTGTEVWGGFYQDNQQVIAKVYIDGELYNQIDLYSSSTLWQQKILLATGLSNDEHTVEIERVHQSNISHSGYAQVNFDFFEYYTSGNELASKDAITINGRETYGLDCTYAKHPNGIQYDARGNLYNDTGGDPSKGSFSCWVKPDLDYDGFTSNVHYIYYNRASSILSGALSLYYYGSDYKFYASVYNGSGWINATSAVQSFSAGDVLHLSMTWDETVGTQLFVNNVMTNNLTAWTAADVQIPICFGNHPISPSSNEALNMIIAEPTFFDYVLTDQEVYDIYTSTVPIWEMDFGRRVEVLNRTNKGMLFNYSGVNDPGHRIGSFAGNLYDTSQPSGTIITESEMTWSSDWNDQGNRRETRLGYATASFIGTEIWACFYAFSDRGIAEYILDEGTSKEKHVLIDQYNSTTLDKYALIATGLENTTHTVKVKKYGSKNISAGSDPVILSGLNTLDRHFVYATSGSENITSDSLTVNNRLIDNVLDCNYTDMPNAITFPDKGNISEYDHEGTIECWVNTTWAGNDGVGHTILEARDGSGNNGIFIQKQTDNNLAVYYENGSSEINITGAVNGTNWAAGIHHILIKWWRPTSSTMGLSMYIDGVKLAENKSQSLTPSSHSQIIIGNSISLSGTYDFEGNILDLSIHNHAFNDGGVAVSASAAVGSEVYNSYHGICRKYKEDLSNQVGDGSTTTFKLSRGLLIDSTAYTDYVYDDSTAVTIISNYQGTYCRANGNILSTDTTILVDSFTNSESEIDTNGGYLYIGQANSLWRKKVEYSAYDAGTNTFTIANSGTVGEDFADNTIIEVCGTVTVDSAPAEGSIVECTYYYSGDSVDREYGLVPDRLNKNLWLDVTGTATSGWSLDSAGYGSGMQIIDTNVRGQVGICNIQKSDLIICNTKDSDQGITQLISNQGTSDEKTIILDFYKSSSEHQALISSFAGMNNNSIIRIVSGVDKNTSSSNYYSYIGSLNLSSQYDLTKDALNSNDVNCVFDYSAIRVFDGQLDYDRDISGNLQLKEAITSTDTTIYIDTDTASDIDRLGRPHGIFKVDNEFIYYEDFADSTSSTEIILLNCKRGYMSDLTGGTATTHSGATSIQLVGAWRNNVNAMNQSWYSSDGAFPYRALLIGCGTIGQVEGGLVIRDLDTDSNYKVLEANDNNAIRGAVKFTSGHTGKICASYGDLAKGFSDIDFISNEILNHGIGVGYGSAAATKGTISQVNDELGWSYTTHIGVTLNSNYVNDIIIYFDATNYNVWASIGKSGATGTSAGINRIYDGGDGLLDTEYDLDADTSYWATKLCYDITNDDLYVSQTLGTANNDILSKISTPKITSDSTIDTADGSTRLTSQPICNDISLEGASNIWFASDSGAKSVVKSTFSSIANTLDSTSFTELDFDSCQTIDYDPCDTKLLIGFGYSSDGLLINCDTNGANPIYYDKSSETDADRNNVLASDILRNVCNIYQDYREIGIQYTSNSYPGWAVATDSGITIKEPDGQSYSTYSDLEVTESNGVYTISVTGTPRREITMTESNGVYTRTLDTDPNPAPMTDKIITESNGVYTSTDQS